MYYRVQLRCVPNKSLNESAKEFYRASSGVTFNVKNRKALLSSVEALLGSDSKEKTINNLPKVSYYNRETLNTEEQHIGIFKGRYVMPDMELKLAELSVDGSCELNLNDLYKTKGNDDIVVIFDSFSIKVEKVRYD